MQTWDRNCWKIMHWICVGICVEKRNAALKCFCNQMLIFLFKKIMHNSWKGLFMQDFKVEQKFIIILYVPNQLIISVENELIVGKVHKQQGYLTSKWYENAQIFFSQVLNISVWKFHNFSCPLSRCLTAVMMKRFFCTFIWNFLNSSLCLILYISIC